MGPFRINSKKGLRSGILAGLLLLQSCTCNSPGSKSSSSPAGAVPAVSSPEEVSIKLVARGKVVYQTNCTACHNSDPKKAGAIGPEVNGASLLLLETKILAGTYPEGYQPKRFSSAMPPMPHLKNDVPAIYAFVNQ